MRQAEVCRSGKEGREEGGRERGGEGGGGALRRAAQSGPEAGGGELRSGAGSVSEGGVDAATSAGRYSVRRRGIWPHRGSGGSGELADFGS